MKRIGIGVMGCASIAQRAVIPAIISLPGKLELKAVASRTADKAKAMAEQFGARAITGYDKLLEQEDIDAIYMPLPTGLHKEWITRSLAAGKHVFVEKSLAIDHAEAKELVELARSKGLLLMENFMFRYHHQHNKIWEHLRNGDIGKMRLFRSQFCFPPLDKNNFRYDKDAGGGSLLDAGAYTIRASHWFLGKELEVISSVLYIDPSSGVDIYGNASLVSKDGVVAQVSFGFDNLYQCNYELSGNTGRLFVPKAFTPKPSEKTTAWLDKPGETISLEAESDNHFINILEAFSKAIELKQHNEHLEDILEQSRLISDTRNSAIKINYESGHHRM